MILWSIVLWNRLLFFLQAYPVVLKGTDVLMTVLGVGAVGAVISLLAAPASDPR